jgi:hypothetical protein
MRNALVHHGRVSLILTGLLFIALMAGLTACPRPPVTPPPVKHEGVYVGQVNAAGALIGLVSDGDTIVAYVCDGKEGWMETVSNWFEGEVHNNSFTLRSVPGAGYGGVGATWELEGTLESNSAHGTYRLGDDVSHNWEAELADPGTAGGLYIHSDDDELIGLVVTNDGQALGLSRIRLSGMTREVLPPTTLIPGRELLVTVETRERTVRVIEDPVELLRRVQPPSDPPPTIGTGTLMIYVLTEQAVAQGYRYSEERPDRIGQPTIRLTEILTEGNAPASAYHGHMQVQLLDRAGGVIAGQYIPDPLIEAVEVPADEKGEEQFWIGRELIDNFLVAVPNVQGLAGVAFTRFDREGNRINAGQINLLEPPIKKLGIKEHHDPADAEHQTIVSNGAPEERMDLLILGDGYTDTPEDRELFMQTVWNTLDYLWSIPTYESIRPFMNVHTAYLPATDPDDRPFGSFYECNDIDRLICLSPEGRNLANVVAADAPGNYGGGSVDAMLILVNDTTWGGSGGAIMISSMHPNAPQIVAHEFGHTVVYLADEYESEYNDNAVAAARTRVNVSGPVSDPNDLKWIHLVDAATAIPTSSKEPACVRSNFCSTSPLPAGTAGMFEGAGYVACGSFRPDTLCIMRCSATPFFCVVCDEAYLNVFDDFEQPTLDIYMRDNILDTGGVPSPSGVEYPVGSGSYVRPWHSVDIRVDAPPFGDPATNPHENPVQGVVNRVYVTVHNRGTDPAPVNAVVWLSYAEATGGAPPYPGVNWHLIGNDNVSVPGQDGSDIAIFEWFVPEGIAPHTCLLAIADSAQDPAPPDPFGTPRVPSLSDFVRDNNNVTWKNLHVVGVPRIQGEISNFDEEDQLVVFRIEAGNIPLGTEFVLEYEPVLLLPRFNPEDTREMVVSEADPDGGLYAFSRQEADQRWLSLWAGLPAGADRAPFILPFELTIRPPGGTPAGTVGTITIEQIHVINEQTGELGDVMGGNTYLVTLE